MTQNIDIINAAVERIIKATILAAQFSGRTRKRSLKRLAAMDVDSKDKEIIFLRDRVNQLKTQISILQKECRKIETINGTGFEKNFLFSATWKLFRYPDAR